MQYSLLWKKQGDSKSQTQTFGPAIGAFYPVTHTALVVNHLMAVTFEL